MPKVKRYEWAHFLDVGTENTPDYAHINKGFTELTEDANAEVTEEQYIGDKNASASVDRYNMSVALEGVAFKGDKVFDCLDEIHRTRATGEGCEKKLLNVDIYNPITGESSTSYPALLQPVVIEITSWGGSVNLSVGATFHYNGDPVEGTCTIGNDGKPVFTPGSVPSR